MIHGLIHEISNKKHGTSNTRQFFKKIQNNTKPKRPKPEIPKFKRPRPSRKIRQVERSTCDKFDAFEEVILTRDCH